MAGIKIVNILKDDTFQDILELFRHTDASEVIFVLPKNGKVFKSEDHFAAFAAEASTGQKTISVLCNNARVTTLARKYHFNVMAAGKEKEEKPKTKATLAKASAPRDDDIDIQDINQDAFQQDNPNVSQDETMGITDPDEVDSEEDLLRDMKIEGGDEEELKEKNEIEEGVDDTEPDLIAAKRSKKPSATLAAAPKDLAAQAVQADLDYIDTMWRQKAQTAAPAVELTIRKPTKPAPQSPFQRVGKALSKAHFPVPKTIALGILGVSLVVLGGVVYITTGSAKVLVTPTSQTLDTQITVQTSDTFSSIDANFDKLPGQLFQVSKTATQEASASGQRDVASKARGKITIYNEYSSSPQPLVATTRFLSVDGLVFRTLQSVTIPGSTIKNGTMIPGTITVDIVADKPGTQYNLSPGDFTVAAFKEKGDTDRAAKIYGKSAVAFSGGASGPSKVVTQADFDTAKEKVTATVTQQIKDAFAAQSKDLMILDTIAPVIASVQSSAQPDDAAPIFSVTATGTLQTVAFRKADLFTLISQEMLKKKRLTVIPEKLTLSYSDIRFSPDTGILTFTISIKGTGYTPLDNQAIVTSIKGMNSAQIHDYFRKLDGVESASVSLSPFWVRAIPQDPEKITISVNYQK